MTLKKKYFYLLAAIFLIALLWLTLKSSSNSATTACPFCDQKVLDYQKFYEDELVVALCTHKPIFSGHCLVMPKRHVKRFEQLTDLEIMQIGRVIKKVDQAVMQALGTSSYLLLQKNGRESGQTVDHVHVHYIPRKAGDRSTIKFLFHMYKANWTKPLSREKMSAITHLIKEKMDQRSQVSESVFE